tara:strand:- start:2235 stop:3020 length:786 start_codon:yes stop_codon:yes gene_type:complete
MSSKPMFNKKKYKKKITDPMFSIITVVKNNELYLEKTILSVLNQTYKNFEYIIVDGKSKDNTLNIIKKYKNRITKWKSEKDNGIYYAFNKGLKMCSGKYICIVNSDDILKKNALKIIFKYIKKFPQADFFFGSVKKHWGILHGYNPKKIKYSWGFYSSHSTGFYLKRLSAKKIGPYNTKYKYHADYDYFYRMIVGYKMKGISTKKNEIVGIFRRGGFSSKINLRKSFFEELRIRYDNNQNIILICIIAFYKFFKHFRKIVL